MLVLDHLHHRIHNNLPDDTPLHNGQKFDLLGLGLLGVPQLAEHFNEIQNKLQELKFDVGDYICIKFLLLLNPGNKPNRTTTRKKRKKSALISLFEETRAPKQHTHFNFLDLNSFPSVVCCRLVCLVRASH